MPKRIQRKRTKGWRMPPDTVSVTRPGPYGNPYTIKGAREAGYRGTDAELAQLCVDMFRADWKRAIECAKRDRTPYMPFGKPIYLGPLKGKNLACWCGPSQPCHATVLIELANPKE
jgi:hypothetical protein